MSCKTRIGRGCLTVFFAACFGAAAGSVRGEPAPVGAAGREPAAPAEPVVDALAEAKAEPDSSWQFRRGGPDESVTTRLSDDLLLTQQRRWNAELQVLIVDSVLTNSSDQAVAAANVPLGDWTYRLGATAGRYRPLKHRNDTWYGSTYWTGPGWTRVGKDWQHPGSNSPSVRRFTAPRAGRVTVTGRVYKAHTKGDGVRLEIRHGQQVVWRAEIDGGDAVGVDPNLTLDVHKGDAVRFVVHKRGEISCDTTHWDPLVTYADGQALRASTGFATKLAPAGVWSYEYEADPQDESDQPRVYGFSADLFLQRQVMRPGSPVEETFARTLPLVVVADGTDQSGIALAVDGSLPCRLRGTAAADGRLDVRLTAGGAAPGNAVNDSSARNSRSSDRSRIRENSDSTANGPNSHEFGYQNRSPRCPPGLTIAAGATVRLPRLVVGTYRGAWPGGMTLLQRALESDGLENLHKKLAAAPPLDFWALVQDAWQQEDKLDGTPAACAAAIAAHIEKGRRLLADLRRNRPPEFLAADAAQFQRLAQLAERLPTGLEPARSLYLRVRRLKRRIALANPLLDFETLLFTKRVPTSYSHEVMQYYGWRARAGGGIFVLDRPGHSLACRDILAGQLASGNVLEPRLSYDARRIVFSFVAGAGREFDPAVISNEGPDEGFYHIWTVNVDGSGLQQLTSGPFDDLMPTWLPDGGIAFCSTRRRGYSRCFGGQFSRRWDVYTLHRMDSDGGKIRTLSFHDTNEWFPTVAHTGHILYARWDYIDRDAVTHQNLWASRPDGTNPIALWGNATARPHCTFQLQPVPNSSKIVFTASAHHSIAGGSIAMVDPSISDNGLEALQRVTPEVPFPEAESRDIRAYYTAPWPLSEKYFLAGYSPQPLAWEPDANAPNALGIYLLDVFGNRELIYRDANIGSTNPCPLRPRPTPPVLASRLPADAPETGEMILLDVYNGLGELPRGSIKRLRVVQIFPKTTNVANQPPIGMAREENARAILGTVPVEADGSARFRVPARKPLLLQALDQDGFAYQTMRSVTYVQPGEQVACLGCHERRRTAPVVRNEDILALRRGPSDIDPGPWGGRPFSYVEVVQPVLDRHCVGCHGPDEPAGGMDLTGAAAAGFSRSYVALMRGVDFWGPGTNPENAAKALVPRFGGRNQVQVTPPGGLYGARGSRLIKLLRAGHEGVELSPEDYRRLAAWIDLNAIFYGVYLPEQQARQLRGEPVAMPAVQ